MGPQLPTPVVYTSRVLTTVEPLEKIAHVETIDPTSTDMLGLDMFVPTFFAYRLKDNSDGLYRELVNQIKGGLRKALVPFFPWAGRWISTRADRGRQLLCNDKGVPFIEAYVDLDLDSTVGTRAGEFQPVPDLQGFSVLGFDAGQFRTQMLPDGLPCAFVQVTRFNCGGLVLGVTFNHMLSDSKSFFDFMTAWADLSRTDKTDMILDYNRPATDNPNSFFPTPALDTVPPLSPLDDMKCYEVSAAVIESLKGEVKRHTDGAYVSTVDCIYAHMWKTLSSLPFSIIGGKQVVVLNVVEGRNRFYDPPLPNVLGNIVSNVRSPDIPIAQLAKMPLSVIASSIRDKMQTTNREEWLSQRVAESLEAFMNDEMLPWQMSSWKSFSMYKIDFGFGNPFFSPGENTRASMPGSLGRTYIGPPTPGVFLSAGFVEICAPRHVLEALEDHPDFLSFFLPQKGLNSASMDTLAT